MRFSFCFFVVVAIVVISSLANGGPNRVRKATYSNRDDTNGTSGNNGTTNGTTSGNNGTTNGTSSGNSTGVNGLNDTNPNPNWPTPGQVLTYRGGPVMSNPIGIHFIFYGTNDTFHDGLLTNFKNFISGGFGQSEYFSITATQLVDGDGNGPSTDISWAGEWRVPAEQYGTTINSTDETFLVQEYARQNQLSLNGDDHYMVFIGDGVSFTTSLKDDCGVHSCSQVNDTTFIYSLVSSTTKTASGCGPQNGPYGQQIDGTIATAVHEIIEAASDPLSDSCGSSDGWFADGNGDENADNCDPFLGTKTLFLNQQTLDSDPSKSWNIQVGDNFYMIAANWNNENFLCENPLN